MNIQTHAYKTAKPKKNDLQVFIEELYKKTSDSETKEQLAAAYKYFQPAIPKLTKNIIEWVCIAKQKENGGRAYLENAYCDGGYLYATDGHRLHYIPFMKDPGYYSVQGVKLDLDYTFPDVKRVIPAKEMKDTIDMRKLKHESNEFVTVSLFNTTYKFNLKYLQNIMQKDNTAEVYSECGCNTSPILFCFENREAVLMPVRP